MAENNRRAEEMVKVKRSDNEKNLVTLDDSMIGILNSLIQERQAGLQQAKQAQIKIEEYLKQCASLKGLPSDEWQFDDVKAGFVKKKG